MLNFLKNLFAGKDPLVEVAKSGDLELFGHSFYETEFVVLSAHFDQALPASGLTTDELAESIEAAAEHGSSEEEIQLFMLEVDGQSILPIFTTHEIAESFVKTFVSQAGQVIPFSAVSIAAEDIAQTFEPDLGVVINPGSPSEFVLTEEHLKAIRRAEE